MSVENPAALIAHIARRFPSWHHADLCSEGYLGFLKAQERHRDTRVPFSAFASLMIRFEMQGYLRRWSGYYRVMRNGVKSAVIPDVVPMTPRRQYRAECWAVASAARESRALAAGSPLRLAVDGLRPRARLVVYETYIKGTPDAELRKRLGLSHPALIQLRWRAIQALRKQLVVEAA